VFKREDRDRDAWIEYYSANKTWHVKPAASRGTGSCWMHSQKASEATQFPWEVAGDWTINNGTVKAWELQHSASVTQWFLPVTISGVTTGDGSAHTANGHYVVVSGETYGGKPVFKREDRDAWIQYHSAQKTWHVKPAASRGTGSCWMQSQDAEATQFPCEVAGDWTVHNGTSKAWEAKPSASVTWILSVTISGVINGDGSEHKWN